MLALFTFSSLVLVLLVLPLRSVDGFAVPTVSQRPPTTTTRIAKFERPSSSLLSSVSMPSTTTQQQLPEGIIKTITQPGQSGASPVRLGDIATVQYSCFVVPSPSSAEDDENANDTGSSTNAVPFCRSLKQKMVVGEGTMIAGWDVVLRSMVVGETCRARLSPSWAYGNAGIVPIVPSNSFVELQIAVLDSQPPTLNIDFDALADTADATPRTAKDIAAAYQARQSAKGVEPELEGLDWFKAKLQSFYFFGLFEGETGQQAPWFLRPSITFPLAFLIVGFTFYISFVSGAITERGAQTTDELDEIVLVSSTMAPFLQSMLS